MKKTLLLLFFIILFLLLQLNRKKVKTQSTHKKQNIIFGDSLINAIEKGATLSKVDAG